MQSIDPYRNRQNSESTSDIDAQIGQQIRDRRERCGYLQSDLAAALHVSHDVISKIELGQRSAKGWELKEIAKALGTTTRDLMG